MNAPLCEARDVPLTATPASSPNPRSRVAPTLFRFWAAATAVLCLLAEASFAPAATPPAEPVPDFQLRDLNPHSARSGQTVSPRDYRLQISAYYFGAAG